MAPLPILNNPQTLRLCHIGNTYHGSRALVPALATIPPALVAALPRGRRCFWWGRGHKYKSSAAMALNQKCQAAYSRILKHKTGRVVLPYSGQHERHLLATRRWYQGSRESSSIERQDDKDKKKDGRSDDERWNNGEWKREYDMVRQESIKQLEELRNFIEQDPYRALFGARERRGAWTPWGSVGKDFRTVCDEWVALARSARQSSEQNHELQARVSRANRTVVESDPEEPVANVFKSDSSSSEHVFDDEYLIDPITNRKVPRSSRSNVKTRPVENKEDGSKNSIELAKGIAVNIPVKRFGPSPKMSDLRESEVDALLSSSKSQPPVSKSNTPKHRTREHRLAGFAAQPWLVQEGFVTSASSKIKSGSSVERTPPIETALNRHLREKEAVSSPGEETSNRAAPEENPSLGRLQLMYKDHETRTEDIDLLRASDVRASAGHTKAKLRRVPREDLEKTWQKLDGIYAVDADIPIKPDQVVKRSTPPQQEPQLPPASIVESLNLNCVISHEAPLSARDLPQRLESPQEFENRIQSIEQEYTRDIQEQDRQRKVAANALDQEVQAQRTSMEDFENSPRRSSADNSKNANGFGSVLSGPVNAAGKVAKSPMEVKASDKALVREIRNIYEEDYGTINTKHIQPISPVGHPEQVESLNFIKENLQGSGAAAKRQTIQDETEQLHKILPSTAQQMSSNLKAKDPTASVQASGNTTAQIPEISKSFKILAFDQATQKMFITKTISSHYVTSSPPRSVPAILTHLTKPTKYFKYMKIVEAAGYQLVAGNRNMLVYQKVTDTGPEVKAMQECISDFLEELAPSIPASEILDTSSLPNSGMKRSQRGKNTGEQGTASLSEGTIEEGTSGVKHAAKETSLLSDENGFEQKQDPITTGADQPLTGLGVKVDLPTEPQSSTLERPSSNHDVSNGAAKLKNRTPSNRPVHREESVFSGQSPYELLMTESQWLEVERNRRLAYEKFRAAKKLNKRQERRKSRLRRFGRAIRTVGFAGLCVAIFAYVFGLLAEHIKLREKRKNIVDSEYRMMTRDNEGLVRSGNNITRSSS